MSEIFKKLQEAAQTAQDANSSAESMKHLTNAFSLFSKEAKRLQNSYDILEDRFNLVNKKLLEKEKDLTSTINDLDSITSYLNNILKNISQGILFIDLDGIITTYNSSCEKILEKDSKTILFNSYLDNFADDFFGFSMKDALFFKSSQKMSFVNFNIKNEKKEVEVTTSFVFDCPPSYQGIIIMLRDVTKLQKLQILANRNDRLKELGEMAASVAHEIKNPLGAIRGYASLLFRDLSENRHLQDMASYILDGTKALERVVNNVLHYTRPINLDLSSINIGDLILEIIKSIKIDIYFSEKIKIQTHLSEKDLFIPADKELIKSALFNILINSYQSMEDKEGLLTISLIKNSMNCLINISDTGQGIEEENLENIFSPFFTTKPNGNGLGLTEANKIVEAHFGSIEVRSKKNRGTTFTITLPLTR